MDGDHTSSTTYRYLPGFYTGTKLYCLVTEAHGCEQLAQSCYLVAARPGFKLTTSQSRVRCPNHYATKPPTKPRLNTKRATRRCINSYQLPHLRPRPQFLRHPEHPLHCPENNHQRQQTSTWCSSTTPAAAAHGHATVAVFVTM